MKELILPLTYEDINSYFKDNERDAKMMEFVSPLNDTEKEIALIVKNINTSGKLAFILGHPGIGKSTFLHTLNWRTHLQIRNVIDVNSSDFIDENFDYLFSHLNKICTQEVQKKDAGVTALIINYLEYIDEFSEESVKSFFRKLNGLLRNTPILILWPVVSKGDVNKMIEYSKQVSGTLYQRDRAIIEINGPNKEDYVDIAKRTIKVLNNGSELSDFGLTHDDLLETYNNFLELPSVEQNLREFYSRITSKWENNNNYLNEITKQIPKPTEVWFIFPFVESESLVNQFSRKGNRVEDAWTAVSDKFSDYIVDNKQRSGKWNSTRLQLALHGAIKSRIMYHPTNLVVTTSLSYSENQNLINTIKRHNVLNHWDKKSHTKKSLQLSPIYKQLIGEQFPSGKRKGGPVLEALKAADPIYKDIVKWITTGGGNDTHLNNAFAACLRDCGIQNVKVEKEHPHIKSVYPDIQIDLGHKIICIEFHYTTQNEPHVIADYCLRKLDVYMNQLQSIYK